MSKSSLSEVVPLSDSEDGLLIVLDRDTWTLRLYYEGVERPPNEIAALLDTAKQMYLEEKSPPEVPPSSSLLN